MSWKEKTIARILLILARMMSEDVWLKRELETLSTHISVHA